MKITNKRKNKRFAFAVYRAVPDPAEGVAKDARSMVYKPTVCCACGRKENYQHRGTYLGHTIFRCRLMNPPRWLQRQGFPFNPMPERGIHLV